MSGTGEDISQVHWKQQWLENGTLYFHVSMTESELLAQTTQATPREPAHILHEHMHLLHISVMVSFLHFFESSCSDRELRVQVGAEMAPLHQHHLLDNFQTLPRSLRTRLVINRKNDQLCVSTWGPSSGRLLHLSTKNLL